VTRIGHGSLSEWVGRDVTCWMMNYCRLVVMVKLKMVLAWRDAREASKAMPFD
jgi:hypothetical protein